MKTEEIIMANAEQISPCIVPLTVYPDSPDIVPNDLLCGGTCFFVKSGDFIFLITAAHVYEEFQKYATERKLLILPANATAPVDISNWRLISKSDFIDIAVIEVPSSFQLKKIGKEAFTYTASENSRIVEKEYVYFMGYPKEIRETSKQEFIAKITIGCDYVTSINDRAFFMSDDTLERKSYSFHQNTIEIRNFGGLSGSPMLTIRNGIFELVGVFIEGGFQDDQGIHSPFRGAHFDFIKSDGRLDELRFPY